MSLGPRCWAPCTAPLSAVVAPLVGLGGAYTATPMFLSMALCSALDFLCYGLTRGAGGGTLVTTAAGERRPQHARR
ncbi:hypothetical protein AOB60_21360 [Streptomyces noursei]|uniref:Uncharacterized protein n=1 Tax=Streptomyces noursei TaxID=1971 RepID=A0A2N8P7I7_STRNR|nr:hypothetical protein AOB60_21360 [Streptomyces noursei]